MEKNIFLLWLQGWDNAPWLQKEVLKSWIINNPGWDIQLIDQNNFMKYVDDINYINDTNKIITPQSKSDIIRLSLLKNYGGVWADASLLCMQPLDHWVFDAIEPSKMWMYHGHGAGLNSDLGPASWFIVSEKNSYLIKKWKKSCDHFWNLNNETKEYFWMDGLFKNLLEKDKGFKNNWVKTPFLYCESGGSSHTLSPYNFKMEKNTKEVKNLLRVRPPYVLKLSSKFVNIFPDLNSKKFKNSNAFCAISLSKESNIYKHNFERPLSLPAPMKKYFFGRIILKFLTKKLKNFLILKI